jgi:hypothetical protein
MARLCVRIAPNGHPTDASLTPKRTREGDVVCVVDDGHVFSHAELNNGHYRIIDVPGVSPAEFVNLCALDIDAFGAMLKRRNVTLDFDVLNSAQWVSKTSATKAQITAITVTRA